MIDDKTTKVAVRFDDNVGLDLSTYRSREYDVDEAPGWLEFISTLLEEKEITKSGIYLLYTYSRVCTHCGGTRHRVHSIYHIAFASDGMWRITVGPSKLSKIPRVTTWPPKY